MNFSTSEAVSRMLNSLGINSREVKSIEYADNYSKAFIHYQLGERSYALSIDFCALDAKSGANYAMADAPEVEKLRRALQVAIKKQYRLKARLDESKVLKRVLIDQLRSSKRPQCAQSQDAHDSTSRCMACGYESNRSAG